MFCCFRGNFARSDLQQETPPQRTTKYAESIKNAHPNSTDLHELQRVHETLSLLRCQLASIQGSWLARVDAGVKSVLMACNSISQVSLFGMSSCGSVLVLLASTNAAPSTGPAAGPRSPCVPSVWLPPGLVLPVPPNWLGPTIAGGSKQVPLTNPDGTAPCCTEAAGGVAGSTTSGSLVILSPTRRAGAGPASRTAGHEDEALVWQATTTTAEIGPLPSDEWLDLVRVLVVDPAAGAHKMPPSPVHAHLLPVRLGSDIVGALLLISTAFEAARPPRLLSPPLSSELAAGMAGAVAECCVGPHLADIQRVTQACCDLAEAPDLQGLADCLCSALTEALAAELHIDFAVHLALVPHAPGMRGGKTQYGFLLTEQPWVATATTAQQQLLQSHPVPKSTTTAPQVTPNCASLQAGGGGPVVATDSLSRVALPHGSGSRHGIRGILQQTMAERLVMTKPMMSPYSSPSSNDFFSVTPTNAHQPQPQLQPAEGLPMVLTAAASGMHAFQLISPDGPGAHRMSRRGRVPSRSWKARPFSLESTLLASLASKAARMAGSGQCSTALRSPTAAATSIGHGVNPTCTISAAFEDGVLQQGGVPPLPRGTMSNQVSFAGGQSNYVAVGSSLKGAMYSTTHGGGGSTNFSAGGVRGIKVCCMGGTVVPHMHAYVNDTDQPSGDVVLLLRTGGPGGGSRGGGGAVPAAGSGALGGGGAGGAGGGGPASLVLVMGTVTLAVEEASTGNFVAAAAMSVEDATSMVVTTAVAPRTRGNGTGSGMLLPLSPNLSSMWPAAIQGASSSSTVLSGGSSGGLDVNLALYMTSQERLPTSLLCAARNRALLLLELLLPAAGACLSDAASMELELLREAASGAATGAIGGSNLGRPTSPSVGRRISANAAAGEGGKATQPASLPQPLPQPQHSHRQQQESHLEANMLTRVAPVDLSTNEPLLDLMPVGSGGREAFEAAPRILRSRLSTATTSTATGCSPAIPTIPANTLGGAVACSNSCNSVVSSLMVSGTNTAAVTGSGMAEMGNGAGLDTANSLAFPLAFYQNHQKASLSSGQKQQQQPPSASLLCPTVTMLQQKEQQQQQQLKLQTSISGHWTPAGGRVRAPPRRHVSDLLATMPWDVYDTLTVMRSNVDILVSSFWNTLRSQNNESAPSPHAEDDIRFLQITRVIGRGGCAVVYAGLLHGFEVAVKVMRVQEEEEMEGDAESQEQQQQQKQQQGQERDDRCVEVEDSEDLLLGPAARQAKLRAIMRGARELAVMTSISHPNIVQIYNYHTRVLVKYDTEEAQVSRTKQVGASIATAAASGVLPQLTPIPEGSVGSVSATGPLQTVLIMECCDLGSLADALDNGLFTSAIRSMDVRSRPTPRRSQTVTMLSTTAAEAGKSPQTSLRNSRGASSIAASSRMSAAAAGGGPMRAIYMTLLEVALALRHMHSMQLVHCDIKPANVLLKSSASDPRGFTCKLTDFGFVNLLQYQVEDVDNPQARPTMRYHEPIGTVTHLAPETLIKGSKLDHTVDIFAFGVLMWEVYTCKAPYAEYARNNFRDVPYRVVREDLRPVFPPLTPTAFKSLAQACWSANVLRRPSAAALVASLQQLMDAAAQA